ncbi:MAG: hypothetical protein AAF089_03395 [Bacteroidota bacterium]
MRTALLGLLLLSGCVSSNIESSKTADYATAVEKLHIETRFVGFSEEVAEGMVDELGYRFQIVEIEYTVRPRVVFLQDEPQEDLPVVFRDASEGTTQILIIEEKQREYVRSNATPPTASGAPGVNGGLPPTGYNNKRSHTVSASLHDMATRERVWHATAEITLENAMTVGSKGVGSRLAELVYEKLAEDGLVPVIPNL